MKPSKFIGVLGSSLGLLGTLSVTTCLVLANNGVIDFSSENVRSYHGEFYDDEVLLSEMTLKRGEKIDVPEAPQKEGDEDGRFYTFIGWDTSGNGLPDVTPSRMYYNFTARAVYLDFKIPDLDDFNIDPSKIDWEKLLELMEKFNISLEDLLKALNLSLDDLPDMIDFEFELDRPLDSVYGGQMLFRTESEGKWSSKKKKWVGSDAFDGNKIGIGDYQPLNFFIDKLQDPTLQSFLNMANINTNRYLYDYDITYSKSFKNYPVPEYESHNTNPAKSDCVSTVDVDNLEYHTSGYTIPYIPGLYNALTKAEFPGDLKDKEAKYRKYAHDHYLEIPSEYQGFLRTELENNGLSFNSEAPDYSVIDQLGEYLGANYQFTMTQKSNGDPVIEINKSRIGSFEYLTTYEIFLLRSLGIPARMVHGYVCQVDGTHGVGDFKASVIANAAEVYFDNLGWVVLNVVNCGLAMGEDQDSGTANDRNKFGDAQKEGSQGGGGSGDISNSLSTKGPGTAGKGGPQVNGQNTSVAKIKSTYNGTIYLKSQSYGDYTGRDWVNTKASYADKNATTSPQSFVYNAATHNGLFSKFTVDIEYLRNLNYGLVPEYSNNTKMDEFVASNNKKEKDKDTFNSVAVNLTKNNIKTLKENAGKDTAQRNTDRKSYESYLSSETKFLDISTLQRQYCQMTDISSDLMSLRYDNTLDAVYKKLVLIKDYLNDNFTYNLDYDYSSMSDSPDILLPFITYKEGICQHFATYATILCRYAGIRARWVTGFATRSIANQECYVSPSACHAWTEVYIDGVGWMVWDCTPGNMNYDRDVSKPQDDSDDSYGKGPGGGGIKDSIERIRVGLKLANISKTYTAGTVKTSDVANILYVAAFSDLSAADFNSKYRIVPQYVYATGTENELLDYEAGIYGINADVYYKILDKQTNSDMTMRFVDPNGNNIANSDGFGIFKNVKVNIAKAQIRIATGSKQGSEFELANEGASLIATVSAITIESTGIALKEIQGIGYVIHDSSITEFEEMFDHLIITDNAIINTAGRIPASVSWRMYTFDKDGEYVDVTSLYQVITEFGELVVG